MNGLRLAFASTTLAHTALCEVPSLAIPEILSGRHDYEGATLTGIVAGKSNTEIAKELGISPTVVRDHTTIIFEKLGVSNRVEAVAAALR